MANFRDPFVEMLISTDSRRASVDDDKAFRDALTDRKAAWDTIDEAEGEPIIEEPVQRKTAKDANRILSILDALEQEALNRKGRVR